ncbi:MAG: 4-hydroxythreonine-4-phosphate dehydrogenase PdxA [Deltaproteobacteria bacterium]|nr:4-hydroxythreonine-4-phosphate dehydrogenase PdxA [Deltaproteobacteria bacterium]
MTLPLAVTLGDPAGIGPEVTAAAARIALGTDPALQLTLCGPRGIADRIAADLGPRVTAEPQAPFAGPLGKPTAASGGAGLAALDAAIALLKQGRARALVTAPLSKTAMALAGSGDRGHTSILERELGDGPVAMAFFGDELRVVLATAHLSLKEMLAALSAARIVEVAHLLTRALERDLGLTKPRLALAGLNPHAGEGGLMGDEESTILAPALAMASARGLSLAGPYPADSVFRRALDRELDGVVALYHDQALIPVKLLGRGRAVHVTLGLKAVRTSPDHGTAFELAGTGRAHPEGMLAAIRLAARLTAAGATAPAPAPRSRDG